MRSVAFCIYSFILNWPQTGEKARACTKTTIFHKFSHIRCIWFVVTFHSHIIAIYALTQTVTLFIILISHSSMIHCLVAPNCAYADMSYWLHRDSQGKIEFAVVYNTNTNTSKLIRFRPARPGGTRKHGTFQTNTIGWIVHVYHVYLCAFGCGCEWMSMRCSIYIFIMWFCWPTEMGSRGIASNPPSANLPEAKTAEVHQHLPSSTSPPIRPNYTIIIE